MLLNLRNMSRSWAFRGFLFIVAAMMAVTLVQGNPLDMLTNLFRPARDGERGGPDGHGARTQP
ncbi:MAG: hypothetical protein WDM79_16830 [Terricaulis sp.]